MEQTDKNAKHCRCFRIIHLHFVLHGGYCLPERVSDGEAPAGFDLERAKVTGRSRIRPLRYGIHKRTVRPFAHGSSCCKTETRRGNGSKKSLMEVGTVPIP